MSKCNSFFTAFHIFLLLIIIQKKKKYPKPSNVTQITKIQLQNNLDSSCPSLKAFTFFFFHNKNIQFFLFFLFLKTIYIFFFSFIIKIQHQTRDIFKIQPPNINIKTQPLSILFSQLYSFLSLIPIKVKVYTAH